jgi:hypothetical protein
MESTTEPLEPDAIKAEAQSLLSASRSAEGGSPWVTAYDGDYYVHNGYSRIASAAFSEEVANLVASAPDLAVMVIRLADELAKTRARVDYTTRLVSNYREAYAGSGDASVERQTSAILAALDGDHEQPGKQCEVCSQPLTINVHGDHEQQPTPDSLRETIVRVIADLERLQ